MDTQTFTTHRPYLFSIAYRMLGTVADAEDVLQEAFLRWEQADRERVSSARGYLGSIVTRLCIDHLRSARVQRETYVGPWLPEPIETPLSGDLADPVTLDESISMAFLVLLESLTPSERAAFLLREVFDYDYGEIAGILERSEASCRQLIHRARERVAERRPRFPVDTGERDRLSSQFLEACATGDLQALVATLSDDVTVWSDGGGKAAAAIRPVRGATNVARFLLGIFSKAPPDLKVRRTEINGQPGVVAWKDGAVLTTMALDVRDNSIVGIYFVRNPDKLKGIEAT